MKHSFKHTLSRFGLYPGLDLIRRLPEIARWLGNGCSGIAPPIKRKVIMRYLRRHSLKVFIETGTHLGDTLAEVAFDKTIRAISIELADYYYNSAPRRFLRYENVELYQGDSGKLMAEIVSKLRPPALWPLSYRGIR